MAPNHGLKYPKGVLTQKEWFLFPTLTFSRTTVDPFFGVVFSPDTQKVLKTAHLGIFRHIGGVGWAPKIWTSKYSGSRVIVAKIAVIGLPGAPQ